MSTKIYNAYKFLGKTNEIIPMLKDIKKIYLNDVKEMLIKYANISFSKKEYDFLDNDYLLKELPSYYLSDILESIMRKGYNVPLNIQSSAMVYFHKDDIYIQFFGLKSKYYDKYKNILIDFHYQNQVDQSNYDWDKEKWDEMTTERQKELEDDWDHRKEVWDEIITDGTFSENGLSFDFNPIGYMLTYFCEEVLQTIKNK